jgi:splicing factor 3B subunit 2
VDVSIDASELETLSEEQLRRKYEASNRGNAGVQSRGGDMSDIVAAESAKRRKMEADRAARKGGTREFKF